MRGNATYLNTLESGFSQRILFNEEGFFCRCFLWHLDVPPNYCYPLRLIHALNQRPRGMPILIGAGRAQHDRRGKAGSERRKACFHPDGSGFHLPREHTGDQSYFQFYSIDFYVPHRFFVTFFTEESNVPLVISPFSSAAAQRRRPGSSRWGWRPKCRPRPRRLRADRPAPRACPGRSPSALPTCPAAE